MSITTPRNARQRLAAPTAAMLPRIGDSLSFLYIDIARIVQDDTGVKALFQLGEEERSVALPTAALGCLLLGPGVSITSRALSTLARHGTTVVCTGAGGVRCYTAGVPDSMPARWLELQARAWADEAERAAVARRMYLQRFGETAPADATIARLRGLEGQRMKALYRLYAQQHGLRPFKRSYDPTDWDDQDPVNRALSAANTCLYGIVHAAINAIGCSPGLGFIHTGTSHSFVYDIADLYKAELTIPLAFSLHNSPDPDGQARRSFRDGLRLFRLLPRIVADIQSLLDPDDGTRREDAEEATEELVDLWDPDFGRLAGGTNYGHD
ncbi:type I-E CRISPR-associated endonuclease Cas1e [Thermomonospora curvata]|uniref:CRISPR-associated endonuclease Cas1 n=1 Tax=Thermomonospora curvata (strain ATCC 19995 / DSM 43183 / JCM 3096 / KCTC 9072 / NBRC 15933 / NCIMB 10081 / Henssen B9) TaxID=471852 RepID=D1A6Q7_THECD|nr:type I-E CRISPR-associated endonuclease Cas1e [Thermomonospora curvata]ACY96532.1 CRISPR-associated protein Cas1 [Thermomonospora curvata DSM 43183]